MNPAQSPPEGAVPLCDYPDAVVRIDCARCPRTGQYRLAALIRRFGSAAGLPEVLAALSADCEHRRDWRITGSCGAGFPDLVLRPVSGSAAVQVSSSTII